MKDKMASVLKVLNYTKADEVGVDEASFVADYNAACIQDEIFLWHRSPQVDLLPIRYDFSGKRALDLGCLNGDLLHRLTHTLSFGVGVDANSRRINAANALKAVSQAENIHFYTFDLNTEDLSMLTSFALGESFDICLCANVLLDVNRWKELLLFCSTNSAALFVETYGNADEQEKQFNFIESLYQNIKLIAYFQNSESMDLDRKMYFCEDPVESHLIPIKFDCEKFIDAQDELSIKNVYENTFLDLIVSPILFLSHNKDHIVVEINNKYILKMPRSSKGSKALASERAITDLMRDQVALTLPKFDIKTHPALIGRYQKISGGGFNLERFEALSTQDRVSFVTQIVDFYFAFHSINLNELAIKKIPLVSTSSIAVDLIKEGLSHERSTSVVSLLNELSSMSFALSVPEKNKVFGHFDLQGDNFILSSDHKNIISVISFGKCKLGDIHQDFSVLNLSSTDLAEEVFLKYEVKTGRPLNRHLIRQYTTLHYLNLLVELKQSNSNHYDDVLTRIESWYYYALREDAREDLLSSKGESLLPDVWRRWLASNLIKGVKAGDLQRILIEQGFPPKESAMDVLVAENHPYILAGKDIFHSLNKRNWLLQVCDELASLDHRYNALIERRHVPEFSVFIREYYSKHLPVILTGGIDHWPALGKWSPEFFLESLGDEAIEIQKNREQDPLFERNSVRHKKKILMREFIQLINKGESNDHYMTANNMKSSFSSLAPLFKDIADFGKGYRQTHSIESGNLLWFGPKGTFTPLHHDLTNNMLVQIYGRKKVTLIPAMQVPNLYNDRGVYSKADYPHFDPLRYPEMKKITPVDLILNPGDALFIPLGWWHCVESLDVSISVSFTNFNAPNMFFKRFPRN